MQTFQNDIQRNTSDAVGHTLNMEARLPFTLNSTAFVEQKQEILDQLLGQNTDALSSTMSKSSHETSTMGKSEALKKAVGLLNDIGIKGLTPHILMTRLSPQTTDSHLYDLLASCMSYFDISSVRFIDVICQQIDYHFLLHFGELLEKELIHGLGLLDKGQADVSGLLVEDAMICKRRNSALERRARLEHAWKSLYQFGF